MPVLQPLSLQDGHVFTSKTEKEGPASQDGVEVEQSSMGISGWAPLGSVWVSAALHFPCDLDPDAHPDPGIPFGLPVSLS